MIDPNIPLQVGAPQFDITKLSELAQLGQQQKSQNALKQILSAPGAIDPSSGLPTDQAVSQVMKVDPKAGLSMAAATAEMKRRLSEDDIKEMGEYSKLINAERDSIANEFGPIVEKQGLNAGASQAKSAWTQALKNLKAMGVKDKVLNNLPQEMTPVLLNNIINSAVSPEKKADLKQKDDDLTERKKRDEIAAKAQAEKEAHDRALEKTADDRAAAAADAGKFTPYQEADTKDDKGNVVPGRVLSFDSKSGKYFDSDGKPTTPGKISKVGSAGQGSPLSDDAAGLIADEVLAGNRMALTGMARNPATVAKVNNLIAEKAKAQGMSGAEVAAKQAEFSGLMAGERTLSTRQVNMENAANEVKYMAPLALKASEKVDRTKYPSLNSVILAAEKGTGDEDVVRLGLAANSLVYMYAKFLNPNGIPTDADKAKATDILSTAWSKGQFGTAVDQIQQEIKAGQSGVQTTRKELKEGVTGRDTTAAQTKHAVGDIIVQGGKRYKASAVDKDGKVTAAEEVP